MRIPFAVGCCLAALVLTERASGHGNPVHVNVAGGTQLTISGGLALADGFAGLAFDPHEDAALDTAPNQKLRSSYPGFDIRNVAPSSSVQLEVIGRPDYSTPGNPMRWLWFWDQTTEKVAIPTGDPKFELISLQTSGRVQVQRASMNMGPAVALANPIGPFLNAHQHLMIYELQNSPVAQTGVYGVFARMTSPGLEPSAPFLLAFRNQVLPSVFEEAALAINAAAVESTPGDLNQDGVVDLLDYVVWRITPGTEEEYEEWRENYEPLIGGGASAANGYAVPEPGLIALFIAAVAVAAGRVRKRRGGTLRTADRDDEHPALHGRVS